MVALAQETTKFCTPFRLSCCKAHEGCGGSVWGACCGLRAIAEDYMGALQFRQQAEHVGSVGAAAADSLHQDFRNCDGTWSVWTYVTLGVMLAS